MNNHQLPVNDVIADLMVALGQAAVVLQAPPGAGKSTALPLALLAALPAASGRIIMLQPRRVAAIGIAHYLAQQLGEEVGQQVGYQVRGQRAYSTQTRLLIVTEGTFTRMIQTDPLLDDVSLVIFDEFHERQLHSDLGLALVLETRQVKPELQLLIMSATLPAADISHWLQTQQQRTQVFVSEGRQYPIDVHYRPPATARDWQQHLPTVVIEAWQQAQQSVLVFLPGRAEISRLAETLQRCLADVPLQQLHGGLALAQQRAVLSPTVSQRRIVLATNIAETSLTLHDIDAVVDCGRERVALFHPQQGISRLLTQRISRASAQQRSGRAGRVRAGSCYRLWPESEQSRLSEYAAADIATQELTSLLLECRAWGSEPSQMAWLTPPNHANLAVAEELLQQLAICNQRGQLTALGQQLPTAASEPRLAVIAYHCAQSRQPDAVLAATAAVLLALLEEVQQLRNLPVDWLSLCTQYWQQRRDSGRWQQRWRLWCQQLQVTEPDNVNFARSAEVLLWGFADRVAQRRPGDATRYLLSYGSGAVLDDSSLSSDWLLALQLTLHDGDSDGRIRLALGLSWNEVEQHPALTFEQHELTRWQGPTQRLVSVSERRLGAIVVERRQSTQQPSAIQRQQAFIDYLQAQGLQCLHWCGASQQLLARLRLLAQHQPQTVPFSLSDEQLLAELEHWAAPYWATLNNLQQLQQWRPYEALLARCDYALQQRLQQQCPSQWQAPSGRSVNIDYCQPQPLAALKLQEAFGEPRSPTLVYGKVTLTLDLLSPAGRLLQRTQDLASFWQGAYQQVKKEMRGRYPKHPWPDDPSSAQATLKTKRQMQS